jgi:hypothetical protein
VVGLPFGPNMHQALLRTAVQLAQAREADGREGAYADRRRGRSPRQRAARGYFLRAPNRARALPA